MEDNKEGINELLKSDHFHFKIEVSEADAEGFSLFAKAHGQHVHEGPDVLTFSAPIKKVTLHDQKVLDEGTLNLNFGTTFAPGPGTGQDLRCVIAGEVTVINALDFTPEDWRAFADRLTTRNAALGLTVPEPNAALDFVIPEPKPENVGSVSLDFSAAPFELKTTLSSDPVSIVPISYKAEYFKAPGRLFDTPRHIEAQGKDTLFPEISRWYQQAAFNRTVGMAAAALTKMDTRETIMDWQSATVEEVADLVFCRSEEGTLTHGEHKERILKAFEALRAIPIPIVKIDWKQIGTDRNPRWIKEYKLRVASLLQSYGPVFVDKKTGKEVVTADPARKKDLVKAKPDRRKTIKKLVEMNPVDGILKAFPAESYTLTRFEWRWNTDIAEDFICPQVALAEDNRPRLKQIKGRHIEGSRFIMLNKQYFSVQKHLRAAGSTYGPRLLDMIVSEKKHITSRGKSAVWIEIEAEKIIKWLDLWGEYQNHPKRVLEDRIAPAVMALIKEKVLLLESWLVPQKDKNEDRRKNPYYRWKVAELWTTVALVPSEEAKDIEDELVAKAEAEETAQSQPQQDAQPTAEQMSLPIIETGPPIPSGVDILAARKAAGVNIRDFARMVKGPDFSTWSRYETGKPIRIGKIKPEVWERVRDFITQHEGNGSNSGENGP